MLELDRQIWGTYFLVARSYDSEMLICPSDGCFYHSLTVTLNPLRGPPIPGPAGPVAAG